MFGFSVGEILFIAFIAILLFGNEKLPQNMKKFLKGWNQTKKVAQDLQKSWHEVKYDIKNNVELLEEKTANSEPIAESSKTPAPIVAKPANYIVSQEEIDSHQTSASS
ncbi:MAG: twin-arginine translocase TatA/TatE family subunit [Bdellovibrionota bacterium]